MGLLPILPATATVIEFGRYARIIAKPKRLFERMHGEAGFYYNDWIEATRLNVTVIPSQTIGSCDPVKRTCDGIRGKLLSGAADYSMTLLPMSGLDAGFSDPHDYAPVAFYAETYWGQFPSEEGQEQANEVVQMLFDFEAPVLVMLIILHLTGFLLLNIAMQYKASTCGRHRFVIKSRGYYSLLNIWQLIVMRPKGWPYKLLRRRVTMGKCRKNVTMTEADLDLRHSGVMLLLSFWTYQTLMGCATSDLSVTSPAKYLMSMQEIADSNRSVFVKPDCVQD